MTYLRDHAQLDENSQIDWLVNECAFISDWWAGSLRYALHFNYQ